MLVAALGDVLEGGKLGVNKFFQYAYFQLDFMHS